jgi:hypothetical protein
MWKNIEPGDNMSWSSQHKDVLHVDFIYSMVYMVYSGHNVASFY